jgi:hypothetical protein
LRCVRNQSRRGFWTGPRGDVECGSRMGRRRGRRGLKRRISWGIRVRYAWYARCCGKGNSYPRHEVGGDDVLDLGRVGFFVVNPAHELVVVDRRGLGDRDNLVHRLLDGRDVLLDELDPELVVVDPAGNLAVGRRGHGGGNQGEDGERSEDEACHENLQVAVSDCNRQRPNRYFDQTVHGHGYGNGHGSSASIGRHLQKVPRGARVFHARAR